MSPACSDKTGKKNASKVPMKLGVFFLPPCFSEWFSKLQYEKNGAWNRQNGSNSFFFSRDILMELLLPAFCTKITWFFHILRKENFKFPVNVLIFNKYTTMFLDTL